MNVEQEVIIAHVLETPNEAETAHDYEVEVESCSLRFVLPRMALVLLMTFAVMGAPIILWRIVLGFGMLQAAGLGGFLTVLFSLTVFTIVWIRRRQSSRDIQGPGEPVQRKTSLKGGFSNGIPWIREKWKAFSRLALLEKEACLYFMLAAIPELGLLLFGPTPLQWSPLVKSLLILTVPAGLVFGLAGLLTGLVFWKKTGQLKIPYLVLVAIYLNFAYESGGAIMIR